MTPREAEKRLDMIRALMTRATRWPGLPASACLVAAACAAAGSAYCGWNGLAFDRPDVLPVWLGVAGASFAQFVGFTLYGARRRRERAFSRLTFAALFSMLPALCSGAFLTVVLPSAQWPGVWMLCYGTAVYGLGYFAGGRAKVVGLLFLAAGALSVTACSDRGVLMMGAAFGGLHALLGILLLCQPKENHEAVLFDEIEDR